MTIYLYVKQCNHCGLKYFGYTNGNNRNYLGSGKYWKLHVNKHGKEHLVDIETYLFDTREEATEFAIAFSYAWNIVDSTKWANLKIENALAGGSKKGRISPNKGKPRPKEWTDKGVQTRMRNGSYIGPGKGQPGKSPSQETRDKISVSLMGKRKLRRVPITEEHRSKLKISQKIRRERESYLK